MPQWPFLFYLFIYWRELDSQRLWTSWKPVHLKVPRRECVQVGPEGSEGSWHHFWGKEKLSQTCPSQTPGLQSLQSETSKGKQMAGGIWTRGRPQVPVPVGAQCLFTLVIPACSVRGPGMCFLCSRVWGMDFRKSSGLLLCVFLIHRVFVFFF